MKILSSIIIVAIFFGCLQNKNEKPKNFRIVWYQVQDKIISSDTLIYKTDYRMIYYGNLVLYEVPRIEMKEFGTEVEDGKVYKKLKATDTTFTYYVSEIGLSKGLTYDSIGTKKPQLFKMDSLLRALNLDTASLNIYEIDLGKPIWTTKNRSIEIEKFGKLLKTDPDSIYRYYDKGLNSLPFSFSKALDKKKGKKLWKTVFIYLKSADKNNKPKPRIESFTKIEEVKIKSPKEFISLFQRFEKDRALFELK